MNAWVEYDAWETKRRSGVNQETRDAVRGGCKRSAAAVLPIVFEHIGTPDGLLDVGAGEGHWMVSYRDIYPGSCLGVDAEARPPGSPGTDEQGWPWVMEWDAESGAPLPLRAGPGNPPTETWYSAWPLALCLEVAEHVTPAAGDHLVAELCRVANAVLWSAAIPGQGGDGHINEQWPDYWNDRFNDHGWMVDDPFRDDLWENPDVEPWYRQNLLLAVPHGVTVQVLGDGKGARPMRSSPPRALVDPVTWAHHRGVPGPVR